MISNGYVTKVVTPADRAPERKDELTILLLND